MLSKSLEELEAKIKEIEDRIEVDDNFVYEDSFQTLYDNLIELRNMIQECEIDSFPYGEVNDKREETFHKQKKVFNKLKSRIIEIENEAGIEKIEAKWMQDDESDDD